jgi:hypothetical protein
MPAAATTLHTLEAASKQRRHQTYQCATSIKNNGAIAGLDEAEQRYQQRALAAAGAADNTDLGRMRQLEGDAVKGRRKRWRVLEADVFEL